MIEFRNESHANLICRIVKVKITGNFFVYIEDAPDVSFSEQQKMEKEGWIFVKPNYFEVLDHVEEVRA